MSIALTFGRSEVVFYLGLECSGQHLLCSGSGDLVEVEQEFFVASFFPFRNGKAPQTTRFETSPNSL
jgi:hypothetical protein